MKKNMHIQIPDEHRQLQFREAKWIDCQNKPILSDKHSNMLHKIKKKLDIKPYISEWDKFKKFSNNYELIHISSNYRRKNENIAFYIPLSRSFFKMWEFIKDFKLLQINSPIRTAHLAEGPGGFIEAVCRYRKLFGHYNDQYFGITLRSIEKEIIIDKKAQTFKNFSMTLGLDDAIAVGTIRNDFPIGDNSNFYATTGFGLGINMLFAGLKYDSDYKKNGISSMLSGGVSTGDDTINKSVQFSVSSKIKISKSNDFFLNLGATLFIPIDVNIVVFLPVVNFTAYF